MDTSSRHEHQKALSEDSLHKAQRNAVFWSTILISGMVMLASVGMIALITAWGGAVKPGVLMPFLFFMAIETLYANEIKKHIRQRFETGWVFHVSELLLLAILLRVVLLIFGGADAQWIAFFSQIETPLSALFVPEYVLNLLIVILMWIFLLISYQDMRVLYNLDELLNWEQLGQAQRDLFKTRQTFLNRFIFLGMMLLIMMIFSSGRWEESGQLLFTFNGEPLRLILIVMGYFLMLLLLMSQTHLARLRTRWWLNQSVIQPRVYRDWFVIGVIFFVVIAFIALLSPTGFAEGFFRVLQSIILFLMMAVQLIFGVILLPITFFLSLFSIGTPQSESESVQEVPQTVEEVIQQTANHTPAWLDTAGNILIWLLLGGVVIFALIQYLRQDRNIGQDIRAFIKRIFSFFKDLWNAFAGRMNDISSAVRTRRGRKKTQIFSRSSEELHQSMPDSSKAGGTWLEVIHLYRKFLRHGEEAGHKRKVSQTPLQYEEQLAESLEPSAQEPVHTITDAFDQARYSQHKISDDNLEVLTKDWEQLQNQLKEKHKK